MSDTSKTAKIIKRWYYSTAHWQSANCRKLQLSVPTFSMPDAAEILSSVSMALYDIIPYSQSLVCSVSAVFFLQVANNTP